MTRHCSGHVVASTLLMLEAFRDILSNAQISLTQLTEPGLVFSKSFYCPSGPSEPWPWKSLPYSTKLKNVLNNALLKITCAWSRSTRDVLAKEIPITTISASATKALSPPITLEEQAAEAGWWGKRGGWLVGGRVGSRWQTAQSLCDTFREHQPWNFSFLLSQVLGGLLGFQHQLSLQILLGRSKKLGNLWCVSEGFSKMNSLFCTCLSFLFIVPAIKDLTHPTSQTLQAWSLYGSALLKCSYRFT